MARTDMAIHTQVHQNPAGGKSGICNKSLDRSCIKKKSSSWTANIVDMLTKNCKRGVKTLT